MSKKLKPITPAIQSFCDLRAEWRVLSAAVSNLREARSTWAKTDPEYAAAMLEVEQYRETPNRDEDKFMTLITRTVDIESAWEESNCYWQNIDSLYALEENMFDAAILCMHEAGYQDRMEAAGITKTIFNRSKLNHLYTLYPRLIKIVVDLNPRL